MNRFPRVLGVRYGYDPDQVDELIRRIEGTLGRGEPAGGPITADEIRDARFRTKLGGYNETAVDYALDAFIVAVEALTGVPAGPGPEARAGEGSGARVTPGPGAPAGAVPDVEPARDAPVPPPDAPAGAGVGAEPARDAVAVPERRPAPGARPAAEAEAVPPDAPPAGAAARPLRVPDPAAPRQERVVLSAEEEALRVERVAFRPGRLGMGYDEEEVDVFLDRVAATLRGTADQPLTAADVREARFGTVIFRPGYAVSQVDAFLNEVAEVLERRLGG
ncbi:hypothetical protein GCM10010466_02420 [Planomonospora alba]|uniref:Cell wall synthesis protein Wag31 n=1 Tax=Planomonospora alba TaxID=161354 RepID=A0ABP6MI04_9ACTN